MRSSHFISPSARPSHGGGGGGTLPGDECASTLSETSQLLVHVLLLGLDPGVPLLDLQLVLQRRPPPLEPHVHQPLDVDPKPLEEPGGRLLSLGVRQGPEQMSLVLVAHLCEIRQSGGETHRSPMRVESRLDGRRAGRVGRKRYGVHVRHRFSRDVGGTKIQSFLCPWTLVVCRC